MKKENAKIWKDRDSQLENKKKYPFNHPLSNEQREFYEAFYTFLTLNKNRTHERWDLYEFRDPFKRKSLKIPITAKGIDYENNKYTEKISDIIRKELLDSRFHDNKYKYKTDSINDLKQCEDTDCDGLVKVYDEIRF